MQSFIRLFDKINSQAQRDRDASLYVDDAYAQKPIHNAMENFNLCIIKPNKDSIFWNFYTGTYKSIAR